MFPRHENVHDDDVGTVLAIFLDRLNTVFERDFMGRNADFSQLFAYAQEVGSRGKYNQAFKVPR